MTRYRICPYDLNKWKVQSKCLFWWFDEKIYHEYSYTKIFETEKEAENWIDDRIESDTSYNLYKKEVAERKRNIQPREYP